MKKNWNIYLGAIFIMALIMSGCASTDRLTVPETMGQEDSVQVTMTEVREKSKQDSMSEGRKKNSESMTSEEMSGSQKDSMSTEQDKTSEVQTENAQTEQKEAEGQKESPGETDKSTSASESEAVQAEPDGPMAAIDAGHQGPGQDMSRTEPNGPGSEIMKARLASGTTGSVSGLDEYELDLEISLKLQSELESRGYQVVMTRTTHDVDLGNIDRAQLANESGAEILVRIHANGSEDSSVSGALTMSPTEKNPFVGGISQECMRLSECIINSYSEATGLKNRGILAEDSMTGMNWSQIPVTILEMGFMTNPEDDAYMADPVNQEAMVRGIADGIDDYFGRDSQ